jgi:hypothetical protein
MVILGTIPAGLIDGLPPEDQAAILEVVGKPVRLSGYDDLGRAELEFTDSLGTIHFIYVNPTSLRITD